MLPILINPRFMLVGLSRPHEDKEKTISDFEELEDLVQTYGGLIYAAVVQNSTRRDNNTYIGQGKALEVTQEIANNKIDVVVVNDYLKSGQLHHLKKIFEDANPNILVWDRVDLILHIFSKHAHTADAKLQIKMAFMRHMGPRIYGMGMELSQQAGGIGTRGKGETNTELMKRHWKNEIRGVQKQIKRLNQNKQDQMDQRKKSGLITISIVGYTNAGKTSLFNRLTQKNNLVEDALFATLDSSVGTFFLPKRRQNAYLVDTIGFIQNLPPHLIDAFKSTLMEAIDCDLLLHVIDASSSWLDNRIEAVKLILEELNAGKKNQIYVFNKMDKATFIKTEDLLKRYSSYHPQFINARSGKGLNELIETIQAVLV